MTIAGARVGGLGVFVGVFVGALVGGDTTTTGTSVGELVAKGGFDTEQYWFLVEGQGERHACRRLS